MSSGPTSKVSSEPIPSSAHDIKYGCGHGARHHDGFAPLAGVRVIDATQALSGPYCTMLLGDLGADVIKVEKPGSGDDSRQWGPPFVGGDATYFHAVNRNKRSVTLDLRSQSGRTSFGHLIESAEVFVHNWRPNVPERLRTTFDDLIVDRPDLIYCAISGFGPPGPDISGYDHVVQGMTGIMDLNGAPGEDPLKLAVPMADLSAGMFAAQTILAALVEHGRRTPRLIEISMRDSLMALLTYHSSAYLATDSPPRSTGNMHPSIVPYGTYPTADRPVNICVGSDDQWQRLCRALGAQELARDELYATNSGRLLHREVIEAALRELLSVRTSGSVILALQDAQVPVGPVLTVAEALEDRGRRRPESVVTYPYRDTTVRVIGAPWIVDGEVQFAVRPAPLLGEHQDEVLGELAEGESNKNAKPR